MKIVVCVFLSFLAFLPLCHGQSFEDQYQQQYNENIAKEYINDVYIPVDVMDAMRMLDNLSNDAGRSRLLEAEEHIAAERLVLGLGKWMMVNWNFFDGSRLSHHLRTYGVTLPDDMAKFLIVTYHRYLRMVPLELEERGQQIFDLRKAEQEERNKAKIVIQEISKSH